MVAPAPLPQPNELLAVDSLWSTDGRATGPAIRTPAGGLGRSRLASSSEYPNKGTPPRGAGAGPVRRAGAGF